MRIPEQRHGCQNREQYVVDKITDMFAKVCKMTSGLDICDRQACHRTEKVETIMAVLTSLASASEEPRDLF